MAIKDWKKIKKGKYGFSYENSKTKDVLTTVYQPKLKYVEVREENGYILIEREFKTKSQAIKFARNCMRKH